ncbi:hypothetical protein LCGC14_1149290 [marine sediment metagenome]|uniref:Uncharacterized protein n=1 Tax=marine sediment metagenome TaxID=412755 RepID=A0A0F9M0Z4_9ZZZZ|nr:hypothetical protein [Candidatus Aminicenantes bacterium]
MPTKLDWLRELAGRDTSSESDEVLMVDILRKIGFPSAVVTCGIVYCDGRGTVEAPPVSVHFMAKVIVDAEDKRLTGLKR